MEITKLYCVIKLTVDLIEIKEVDFFGITLCLSGYDKFIEFYCGN